MSQVHINGGVKYRDPETGETHDVKSKVKLKELIHKEPQNIHFYTTGLLGPKFEGCVNQLTDPATILNVCGPSPYNDRRWYATIRRVGMPLQVR